MEDILGTLSDQLRENVDEGVRSLAVIAGEALTSDLTVLRQGTGANDGDDSPGAKVNSAVDAPSSRTNDAPTNDSGETREPWRVAIGPSQGTAQPITSGSNMQTFSQSVSSAVAATLSEENNIPSAGYSVENQGLVSGGTRALNIALGNVIAGSPTSRDAAVIAGTDPLQDFIPPWSGKISPDGLWRISGPWTGTGGNFLDPTLAVVTQTFGGGSSGYLELSVAPNQLRGSEIQSLQAYGYGTYETRMEVTSVPGVVASFFWIQAPNYGPHEWDIEFLTNESWINSANSGIVHLTIHPSNATVALPLSFNPSKGFHDYGFVWSSGKITFTVDEAAVYTFTSSDLTTTSTGFIMANTWTGNPNWGGGPPTQQATTVYDWMQYTPAVACFCAGTRIATPTGDVPVEQIVVGDLVSSVSGAARPVVWIGLGRGLATRGRRTDSTPIIVRRGALADNVPHHDLRLTKGHALYLDGVLIPVEFLINHRSILWDDRAQDVEFYHLELESHDVLVANGAPAESYRDDGNRWMFQNAISGHHLLPQCPCAPVLTGGQIVDEIWRWLLDRAGTAAMISTTDDPDLHIIANGRCIYGRHDNDGIYRFRLPQSVRHVRVVSRAAAPCELGFARDPRRLGVALRRIMLWQGARLRLIEASDPALREGFHLFEHDNDFRWTDGDACLPETFFDGLTGVIELELSVGATTRYALRDETAIAA